MKKKKSIKGLILFIFVLIVAFIGALTFLYYPYSLEVREYKIESDNLPQGFDGFKIVHFSDVHYGTTIKEHELQNFIKEINMFKPDMVVFTGDLFDRNIKYSDEELENLKKYLLEINADIGKYAVTGNHDYSGKKSSQFDSVMEESGFKVLKNTYELIYYSDATPIFIGGFPSNLKEKQNLEEIFSYFDENESLYKIILFHEPDSFEKLKSYDVDLVLAGHSHNGQVRFPFIGAVTTPKGAKTYYESYYKNEESDLFISGGFGTTTLPIRLLNKSSFNLYRFYKK